MVALAGALVPRKALRFRETGVEVALLFPERLPATSAMLEFGGHRPGSRARTSGKARSRGARRPAAYDWKARPSQAGMLRPGLPWCAAPRQRPGGGATRPRPSWSATARPRLLHRDQAASDGGALRAAFGAGRIGVLRPLFGDSPGSSRRPSRPLAIVTPWPSGHSSIGEFGSADGMRFGLLQPVEQLPASRPIGSPGSLQRRRFATAVQTVWRGDTMRPCFAVVPEF